MLSDRRAIEAKQKREGPNLSLLYHVRKQAGGWESIQLSRERNIKLAQSIMVQYEGYNLKSPGRGERRTCRGVRARLGSSER